MCKSSKYKIYIFFNPIICVRNYYKGWCINKMMIKTVDRLIRNIKERELKRVYIYVGNTLIGDSCLKKLNELIGDKVELWLMSTRKPTDTIKFTNEDILVVFDIAVRNHYNYEYLVELMIKATEGGGLRVLTEDIFGVTREDVEGI